MRPRRLRPVPSVLLGAAFLGALAFGCRGDGEEDLLRPLAPGVYTYRADDASGRAAAEGRLSLVSDAAGGITGSWRIARVGEFREIGPQLGAGLLAGALEGDSAWINLNPGWADNNVLLVGRLTADQFEGRWQWIGFAGVQAGGDFDARRSRGEP